MQGYMRFKEMHEDRCVKARNATVVFLVGGHLSAKLGGRGTEKGGSEVTFSEKSHRKSLANFVDDELEARLKPETGVGY
jgi:hypothetical protein